MSIAKNALSYILIVFLSICLFEAHGQTVQKSDRVCGRWESNEKNLIVDVYKKGDEFRAKIVWFKDDISKPMDEWRDTHNPDPALRSRKILGLDVMRDFKYNKDDDTWEDGLIYDAQHGKEWNASGYIDEHGQLRVRGFWHFKLFGKTMVFRRVS